MEKELEKFLVEKYPDIFRDYRGDPRKTCMAFGMSCEKGWYQIINSMCRDISKLIKNKDIIFVADQVKEKFGGLRFYYHLEGNFNTLPKRIIRVIRIAMYNRKLGRLYNRLSNFREKFWKTLDEKIYDIVEKAESKSYITCEFCGEPGSQRGSGWVKTLCNHCGDKFEDGKRPWEEGWLD